MDEKALDALRIGLEDSYWYGDDDEKVFNELVRKAEAFDEIQKYHKKYMNVMQKQFDEDLRGSNLHVISMGSAVLKYFAEAEEADQ